MNRLVGRIAVVAVFLIVVGFTASQTFLAGSGTPQPLGAQGLVASNFKNGALSQPIVEEACTLTDGTETTCYRVIVTGTPVDTVVGPFCPETTSTSAADSGIWLDGSNIYDADGQFILDLSTIYGDAQWRLYDESGKVNVTDSKESFQGAARPDVLDAYKYHCVEGRFEWTNTGAAVPISILVPVTPVKASSPVSTQGADLGVTINGLVIAPSAPVQAILKAYTIAAFDDCGGHFNPIEGYHLHAFTDCKGSAYDASVDDPNAETRLIGYALDGVAVFAPLAHDTTIQLDVYKSFQKTNDLYMDTSDLFDQAKAMVTFHTLQSATIPNDQEGFLKWLSKGVDEPDYSSAPLARHGKQDSETFVKAKGSLSGLPSSTSKPTGTTPSGPLAAKSSK